MPMRGDALITTADSPSVTTRFLLLSAPRSGSTLLADELDRRWTEIRSAGESFNPIRRSPSDCFEDLAGIAFEDDAGASIVGVKIFGPHVSEHQLSVLLGFDGMRVIILRRRDQLRRYVSEQIAHKTGRWREFQSVGTIEEIPAQERSVHVDTAELLMSIRNSEDHFARFETLSTGISRIDLWYEDLVADLDGQLRRVAGFLGAGEPDNESPPRLVRQNPEPLSTLITNYDEVESLLSRIGRGDLLMLEQPPTSSPIDEPSIGGSRHEPTTGDR